MTMQPERPSRRPSRVDPDHGRRGPLPAAPRVALPTPLQPRPMERIMEALADLSVGLADEGIEVGGVFAQPQVIPRLPVREEAAAIDADGEDFVARFDLPTTRNDAVPVPRSLILALVREMYDEFGGASFLEVAGLWRDERGACFVDVSIAVEVWTSDRERLVAFVERACQTLGQKAIPIRIYRPEFITVRDVGDAQ